MVLHTTETYTTTPSLTPTPTYSPTLTYSSTSTPSHTQTQTYTSSPTSTSTFTSTPTHTATASPTFTPTPKLPTAPTGLTLSDVANNDGDITATWNENDPAEQITNYLLFVDGSQDWSGPVTTRTTSGLTNGIPYTITIKAVNSRGESGTSFPQANTP